MTGVAGLIVSDSVCVPVPFEFVALNRTLVLPATAGTPDICPVNVFIESPLGRPVALKLVGLFVPVIW